MACAPIAIARQSMSTKEIDRDLMFHRNKMPNYKQTERVHKLIVLISDFFSINIVLFLTKELGEFWILKFYLRV